MFKFNPLTGNFDYYEKTDLTGYATESWVAAQGYLTSVSAASTYVPYTGATTNVNLGINNLYNGGQGWNVAPLSYAIHLAGISVGFGKASYTMPTDYFSVDLWVSSGNVSIAQGLLRSPGDTSIRTKGYKLYHDASGKVHFGINVGDVTSSTNIAIGTGSKTFTVATGKSYIAGQSVTAFKDATHYMVGTITSYNSGTGSLVLNITSTVGTGTYNSWTIFMWQEAISDSSLTLNTWTHITGTWDYSAGANNVKLYINGTLQTIQGTAPNIEYSTASSDGYLGSAIVLQTGLTLIGNLDEVHFYNRTLGQTEINQLYNSGNGYYGVISTTGFWTGYHFDGAGYYISSGLVAEPDFSSNNNYGTISGVTNNSYTTGKVTNTSANTQTSINILWSNNLDLNGFSGSNQTWTHMPLASGILIKDFTDFQVPANKRLGWLLDFYTNPYSSIDANGASLGDPTCMDIEFRVTQALSSGQLSSPTCINTVIYDDRTITGSCGSSSNQANANYEALWNNKTVNINNGVNWGDYYVARSITLSGSPNYLNAGSIYANDAPQVASLYLSYTPNVHCPLYFNSSVLSVSSYLAPTLYSGSGGALNPSLNIGIDINGINYVANISGGSDDGCDVYGIHLANITTSNGNAYGVYDESGCDWALLSDTQKMFFGAGQDASISYSGSSFDINSSEVAPSDIKVTCGANKTIELQNNVYEDLQFPTGSGKVPASNAPNWEALTTNTSSYAFIVNDYIDLQSGEVPHSWVEGTSGDLHIHFTIKNLQNSGGNQYAKFTAYVAISDQTVGSGREVWTEVGPFTAEKTIPTGSAALKSFYLDMGDITLTNYKVGSQMKIRIKRIASTSEGGAKEYGTGLADTKIFITQVGVHFQRNTVGSRSETTK